MGRDFTKCREMLFLFTRKMQLKFKTKQTCRLPAKQKTEQHEAHQAANRNNAAVDATHIFPFADGAESCCTVAMRELLPSPSILPEPHSNLDFIMAEIITGNQRRNLQDNVPDRNAWFARGQTERDPI